MALYHCGQPNCRGHHSFAIDCSAAAGYDYPALVAFQVAPVLQPIAAETPAVRIDPGLVQRLNNQRRKPARRPRGWRMQAAEAAQTA
ncbi:MAG: hypothetical protein JNM70_13635 [Anaerolineae bacterium]|nr:hypothetical protein [Anaerolineae bacterium]